MGKARGWCANSVAAIRAGAAFFLEPSLMSFSLFHAAIVSPGLKRVAAHWNDRAQRGACRAGLTSGLPQSLRNCRSSGPTDTMRKPRNSSDGWPASRSPACWAAAFAAHRWPRSWRRRLCLDLRAAPARGYGAGASCGGRSCLPPSRSLRQRRAHRSPTRRGRNDTGRCFGATEYEFDTLAPAGPEAMPETLQWFALD